MKAAALGHQYLTVKSQNKQDSYYISSRSRLERRRPLIEPQANPFYEEENVHPTPATDPLGRRSPAIMEESHENVPSVAIIGRSISEPNELYVRYQSEPLVRSVQMPTDEKHTPFSLAAVLSKRHGNGDDHGRMSSRVRKFYKKQDAFIDSLEKMYTEDSSNLSETAKRFTREKNYTEWLIRATLVLNCTLFICKIVAAVLSRSLSIISSVVDSAVDSASACLLFWAVRAIKRRNPYTYPGGRSRLEPVIIVILSVVMVSASVQVIFESTEGLVGYIEYFTKNSTELRHIDMGPVPITVMCVTVVCKAILSFLCFRIHNPTMRALAHDHLNDVFSNIVALVCGIIAAKALDGSIRNTSVVVIDPVGAILVSLYIIFCWGRQLREQIRNLSGYKAEPDFIQKITWLTFHHSPFIRQIDTVRAFHFGTSFLVEVELILPETMSLKEAHDIGDSLKEKLERLPEVEIAFVHLDYTIDPLQY